MADMPVMAAGKDCTKVDRSAAYAARYAAKNLVAAGLADKCELQLSYAIGVAHPTSVMVDTFGTGKLSDEKLVEIVRKHFDLRPASLRCWICAVPSTSRRQPTATLEERMWTFPGSGWIRWKS